MTERDKLEQAIAALEAQRAALGDAVVDVAVAALRQKISAWEETQRALFPPDEQRKQVTVLFGDLSGFTEMSERMDAEDVGRVMNALWERLDGLIVEHGGTIDKHIGDAVMALFGAPIAREDDPERAVRAALAVQSEMREFGAREDIPLLRMRIAIHTGPVVLGKVGTTAEYTAMGDVVNVASRMQQAAPLGEVLVSHDTYRHVRGLFDLQPMEPMYFKGKSEAIPVYVVRGLRPRAFRPGTRGVEGIATRMIGRKKELRLLQTTLRRAMQQKQLHVVTVFGEAGVGKSRLLHEFERWVEELPEEIPVFKGRASLQTSNLPDFLIRDLLAFFFGIRDSDRAVLARERLEQGIVSWMGQAGLEKAHFIGQLVGLDFSASPFLRGILDDARQIRERALHYIAQFFSTAAREKQAALILVEDVHWADEGSLDVLERLMQGCRDTPLMIVALSRPEFFERRPSWGQMAALPPGPADEWCALLELQPLSRPSSRRLVKEILRKVQEIPVGLPELIVGRAEGNPFYVEELIKMLIEDGVIVKGPDYWQVQEGRLAEVRIPPTLTGVLQARLDGLPPLEREVLQRAAVVGRIFWDGAVRRVGELAVGRPVGAAHTDRALEVLCDKELVFGRKTSAFARTQEYLFKHAILHDVTYESVLLRLRRLYHARVAAWLIEQSGERVGEYAGLIGEHYERAGQDSLAVDWYIQAGQQAQATYAPEAATGYFQRGLALLPGSGEENLLTRQVALCKGLAEMFAWQARYAEATEALRWMLQAAEEAGDVSAQMRAWTVLTRVQSQQGDYLAALESAEQAEAIAREAGESLQVELANLLGHKGWIYLSLRDVSAALALAKEALALSSALGSSVIMASSLNLLGAVHHYLLGRYPLAVRYYEQALHLFRGLGDREGVAGMLNNLAEVARMGGDYAAAVARYQEARGIAREIGSRHGEIVYLSNLGGASVGLGEYRRAEEDLRQVVQMAESAGLSLFFLPETYRFLAEACLGQGKMPEALAAAQQALRLGQESGQQEFVAGGWFVLGRVAAGLAEPVVFGERTLGAADCFEESRRLFGELGMEEDAAQVLQEWARHELQRGDQECASSRWQEAQAILRRLGKELDEALFFPDR